MATYKKQIAPGVFTSHTDENVGFGREAIDYQQQADASMNGSVGAASQGLTAAQQGQRQAQMFLSNLPGSINRLNLFADQAGVAAGNMTQDINAVRRSADGLTPYANQLRDWSGTMWNQGSDLYSRGTGIMDMGSGILNMNADPNSLAGQYVSALKAIDPDRYVSMAASDVQGSFSNAQGQMQRALSRQGASASGSKSQALQQAWAQALAAAQSGAKTRARQVGLNERMAALQGGIATAQGLVASGGQLTAQGVQTQGTAGNMQNQAAGIVTAQGGLQAQAGQLQASQANAYTAAGQVAGQAGALSINAAGAVGDAAGNVVSAANALANAQANAAQYYAGVGQGYGSLAGSGGLAHALFGQGDATKSLTSAQQEREQAENVKKMNSGISY